MSAVQRSPGGERVIHLNRYGLPGPMHHDLVNLRSEAEHSTHALPRGLDKETVASWIGAILKGTKEGDLRAVRLVRSAMMDRQRESEVPYPPLYEALMFGAGKLGDIESMLSLWRSLWRHHVAAVTVTAADADGGGAGAGGRGLVSSSTISLVLECLCSHRRWLEAERLMAAWLSMADGVAAVNSVEPRPDGNCFAAMLKHCTWTRDWKRSELYFRTMVGRYGLRPTSLCFRYLLQTAAHCHPPKWEEALSMLRSMERDWNIAPNAAHFATVIHAVATRWAVVESPLSQDAVVQMDSGHHFEIYKKRLLHGRLFEGGSSSASRSSSTTEDVERALDLFHAMTEEMGIVPNDRVFAELFRACDGARNLEMALRIRSFWRLRFPMIRQQALSLHRLVAICSTLCSWRDALAIYKEAVFVDEGDRSHSLRVRPRADIDSGHDALYSFDGDALSLSAAHKVQPEMGVLNQMLRCSMKDVSRRILEHGLTEEAAPKVLAERAHFVESEMRKFQFAPNDMTWAFLLQSAAIAASKPMLRRVLRNYFEFQTPPNRRKKSSNRRQITAQMDTANETTDCWRCYEANRDRIEMRPAVRNTAIAALYWTQQMDRALMLYHEHYAVRQRFTHWFAPKMRAEPEPQPEPERIMLDFHGFDPAVSVVALRYVLENEFEAVHRHLLSGQHRDGGRGGAAAVDDDGHDDGDNGHGIDHQFDADKLEMTLSLRTDDDGDDDGGVGVKSRSAKRGRNLLIVTGRGKGNERGTSVLRPWIKLWLQNEADPPIRSHIDPRNAGILVVDSGDILKHIEANRTKWSAVDYRQIWHDDDGFDEQTV